MLDKFDKKENPFRVPENYFEDFGANIMNQLPKPERKVAKKVSLWEKVLPWTAVAAILWGVIVSAGFLDKDISPLKNSKPSSDKGIVSSATSVTEEEDFYLYVQDEAVSTMYDDVLYFEN